MIFNKTRKTYLRKTHYLFPDVSNAVLLSNDGMQCLHSSHVFSQPPLHWELEPFGSVLNFLLFMNSINTKVKDNLHFIPLFFVFLFYCITYWISVLSSCH